VLRRKPGDPLRSTAPLLLKGPPGQRQLVPACAQRRAPNLSNAVRPFFHSRHEADTMNSSRAFTRTTQNTFRKPLDFLNNLSKGSVQLPKDRKRRESNTHQRTHSQSSLDDTDHSDVELYAQMESSRKSHSTQNSQADLHPAVLLIDIGSRSNSPYPRIRSAVQSEDEDDEYEPASFTRPLVSQDVGRGSHVFRGFWQQGGPGAFFFGTWRGWQAWVGLLVFWVGGCSFGLLLMNRFIMLTGVYK
jgi:hypothetical protein